MAVHKESRLHRLKGAGDAAPTVGRIGQGVGRPAMRVPFNHRLDLREERVRRVVGEQHVCLTPSDHVINVDVGDLLAGPPGAPLCPPGGGSSHSSGGEVLQPPPGWTVQIAEACRTVPAAA